MTNRAAVIVTIETIRNKQFIAENITWVKQLTLRRTLLIIQKIMKITEIDAQHTDKKQTVKKLRKTLTKI